MGWFHDCIYFYYGLLLVAFKAPVQCGVVYRHTGRSSLKKPEGKEGLEKDERYSKTERMPRFEG